jgi:hypothetical protein
MAEEYEEDPCSRFVDYTNATPWEEFIAEIEQQLRRWNLNDKGVYSVEQGSANAADGCVVGNGYFTKELTLDGNQGLYCTLTLYTGQTSPPVWKAGEEHFTPTMLALADPSADFAKRRCAHVLQSWFGLEQLLVLSPNQQTNFMGSSNTESSLATLLLSSMTIALGNCRSALPAFVPFSNPSKAAYRGYCQASTEGGATVTFNTEMGEMSATTISHAVDLFKAKVQLHDGMSASLHHGVLLSVCYRWKRVLVMPRDLIKKMAWRLEHDGYFAPDATVQALKGNNSAIWGPIKNPLKKVELTACWWGLREGSYVDNAVYSSLDPVEAPAWFVNCQWDPSAGLLNGAGGGSAASRAAESTPLSELLRTLLVAYIKVGGEWYVV